MATLSAAMPFLLRNEGGKVNDSADPGGATNHGVTFIAAQRLLGFTTLDQLWNITPDQLLQVYGSPEYWRYDGVSDQRVASKLFDIGVDCGLGTEVRCLQKILGVADDGVWGPATLAATNAQEPNQLLQALCEAAREHYIAVAQAHPREGKFLNGWEKRAEEIPDAA